MNEMYKKKHYLIDEASFEAIRYMTEMGLNFIQRRFKNNNQN